MRVGRIVLFASIVLSLAAARLQAQRQDRAGRKNTAAQPTERGLTQDVQFTKGHTSAIYRLQTDALGAAVRANQLAHARNMNRGAIQAQAAVSRNDLQAALKQLDSAEATATEAQKAIIASVLVDDRAALQHADQLVATAQQANATGSAIATHAQAVVAQLQKARIALETDPATGLPAGRRQPLVRTRQASKPQ